MTIRRAFTLVELLVVISIIGMLSSIAIISTNGSREKARLAAGASFAAQLDRVNGASSAGEWLFNEGSGTTVGDASGGNHGGSLTNGPTWSTDTPSGKGYSVSFNGSNAYVTIPDYYGLKYAGGTLTMAAWVKPDPAETDGGHILSKSWNAAGEYNYRLIYNSNKTISAYFSGGGVQYGLTTTASVPAGKWSFVAATVDSSNNVNIYIDGSLRSTGVNTIGSWVPSGGDLSIPLAIGTLYPYGTGWGGNSGFSFNGLVDDPRIFNGVLSAERIRKLYAEESGQTPFSDVKGSVPVRLSSPRERDGAS
jgi:prepilin-type N-terminal cleavage/methylation domain-containing protein